MFCKISLGLLLEYLKNRVSSCEYLFEIMVHVLDHHDVVVEYFFVFWVNTLTCDCWTLLRNGMQRLEHGFVDTLITFVDHVSDVKFIIADHLHRQLILYFGGKRLEFGLVSTNAQRAIQGGLKLTGKTFMKGITPFLFLIFTLVSSIAFTWSSKNLENNPARRACNFCSILSMNS